PYWVGRAGDRERRAAQGTALIIALEDPQAAVHRLTGDDDGVLQMGHAEGHQLRRRVEIIALRRLGLGNQILTPGEVRDLDHTVTVAVGERLVVAVGIVDPD